MLGTLTNVVYAQMYLNVYQILIAIIWKKHYGQIGLATQALCNTEVWPWVSEKVLKYVCVQTHEPR